MTTAQIALSVIMIVASLFLIVVVLLQHGAQQGLGRCIRLRRHLLRLRQGKRIRPYLCSSDLDCRRCFRHHCNRPEPHPLRCRRFSDCSCCCLPRLAALTVLQQIRYGMICGRSEQEDKQDDPKAKACRQQSTIYAIAAAISLIVNIIIGALSK